MKKYFATIIITFMSADALASLTLLPVPRINQEDIAVCWACAATALLGAYDEYPDERGIYSDEEHLGPCVAINWDKWDKLGCDTDTSTSCDVDCCTDTDTSHWQSETICNYSNNTANILDHVGLSHTHYDRALNISPTDEIAVQIVTNKRPFIIGWDMGVGNHVLTGTGYDPTSNDLCIMNPTKPGGSMRAGHSCDTYDHIKRYPSSGTAIWEWNATRVINTAVPDDVTLKNVINYPQAAFSEPPSTHVDKYVLIDSDGDGTDGYDYAGYYPQGNLIAEDYEIDSESAVVFICNTGKTIKLKTGFRAYTGASFVAYIQ